MTRGPVDGTNIALKYAMNATFDNYVLHYFRQKVTILHTVMMGRGKDESRQIYHTNTRCWHTHMLKSEKEQSLLLYYPCTRQELNKS